MVNTSLNSSSKKITLHHKSTIDPFPAQSGVVPKTHQPISIAPMSASIFSAALAVKYHLQMNFAWAPFRECFYILDKKKKKRMRGRGKLSLVAARVKLLARMALDLFYVRSFWVLPLDHLFTIYELYWGEGDYYVLFILVLSYFYFWEERSSDE